MNISSKPLSRVKVLLPVLIVLILVFNFTPLGDSIKNLYLSMSSPLQSAFWSRGMSFNGNVDNNDYDSELLAEIASLRRQLKEMDEMKEALDMDLDEEFDFLGSRVVGKASDSDHLIVSSGEVDGVSEGMPIVNSSKSLVGEVVEVLDDFSYIKLITHSETAFDGRVLEKDDSLGVVESNESLRMNMIDRGADLEEGDMIVTSPGGGIYPAGIFVGEVEEVIREDADTFQSVNIEPGFTPEDLQILFIITDF